MGLKALKMIEATMFKVTDVSLIFLLDMVHAQTFFASLSIKFNIVLDFQLLT